MNWTIKGNDGRDYDWRCFFGKHRYGPWGEPDFTGTVWHVCERCGEWDWQRTRHERIGLWACVLFLMSLPAVWILVGVKKLVEWIA